MSQQLDASVPARRRVARSEGTAPERVAWKDFHSWWCGTHERGQHVSIVAATGSGKTVLAQRLLDSRGFVVIADVKGDDPSLLGYKKARVIKDWPPKEYNERGERLRLAPPTQRDKLPNQRFVFRRMLDGVYDTGTPAGGWTVYLDELRAMTDRTYIPGVSLKLRPEIERLYLRGRSKSVTVVASTQAPVEVPSSFYSQASHTFLFRILDQRALKRLSEIGGNTMAIEDGIRSLGQYEFLYVGREDPDRLIVSKVEGVR